jgi:putative flippase GtrA
MTGATEDHGPVRHFLRFIAVGLANSAIGFAVIVAGLRAGLGDYRANALGYAVGLCVSYVLQRRWAFAVSHRADAREVVLFLAAAGSAYAANLAVILAARRAGHSDSPVAQAVAMAAYSLVFFALSRLVVFARRADAARGSR